MEREQSGFIGSDGLPTCYIVTPLIDTPTAVRPCIRPFVDSTVRVIVTLISDIRGPLC